MLSLVLGSIILSHPLGAIWSSVMGTISGTVLAKLLGTQTGPLAALGCFGSAFVYMAFHHSDATWIVRLRDLIRPRDRSFKTWRTALQAGLGAGLFGLCAIPE